MFGLGFGEILIIIIVGVVVLGPRKLPEMMRTAGQWVTKVRRLTVQLRAESGIDDIIRSEGLEREIRELRGLASSNVLGSIAAATAPPYGASPTPGVANSGGALPAPSSRPVLAGVLPMREREWPEVGCDAAGALPDVHAAQAAKPPDEPLVVADDPRQPASSEVEKSPPEATQLVEGAPGIAARKLPEGTVAAGSEPA